MKYFVSGPISAGTLERYQADLDTALGNKNSEFVIGDAQGIDSLAQEYLQTKLSFDQQHERVTVYHMGIEPRHCLGHFQRKGGYTSDLLRDLAMTRDSDVDIAYPSDPEEMKRKLGKKYKAGFISGTEANLIRRDMISNI